MGTNSISRMPIRQQASISLIIATLFSDEHKIVPEEFHPFTSKKMHYEWGDSILNTPYKINRKEIDHKDNEKMLILQDFATKILANIEDLEPDIITAINENIWDLV